MEGGRTEESRTSPRRYRWLFAYEVDGDLRFLSHHDTLRMFRRALARAEIPVRWSEGFNPHPRLSIPIPRPVGVASRAEYLVIETREPLVADDALRRLQEHVPPLIRLTGFEALPPGAALVPARVCYELDPADAPHDLLRARIAKVLGAETLPVERRDAEGRPGKVIDIRPYVEELQLEGGRVSLTLAQNERGTARPAEVAALLGFDPRSINHRICRTRVEWRTTPKPSGKITSS